MYAKIKVYDRVGLYTLASGREVSQLKLKSVLMIEGEGFNCEFVDPGPNYEVSFKYSVRELYTNTNWAGSHKVEHTKGRCLLIDAYGCRNFKDPIFIAAPADIKIFSDDCKELSFIEAYGVEAQQDSTTEEVTTKETEE